MIKEIFPNFEEKEEEKETKRYLVPKKPLVQGRRFYFRAKSSEKIALQGETREWDYEELTGEELEERLDALKEYGFEELTEDNLIGVFKKVRQKKLEKYQEEGKTYLKDLVNFRCYEEKLCLSLLSEIGTGKSIDFAVDFIKNNPDAIMLFHRELIDIIKSINPNYTSQKILEILANERSQETESLIIILTILVGVEQTRDKLNQLIEQNQDNQRAVDNLEYARSFITPNDDKIAITNLRKFYENEIKFEEYEVNKKMNEKEVKLLESLIDKNEKALEMGCGTGRLASELVWDGYDVTGYDYASPHVEKTKRAIEEKSGQALRLGSGQALQLGSEQAKVFQGNWHNNAIKDESFDKIYSLGRNILHEYSLPHQVNLFREAHRILKPGGRFIFDIPDREKGGYKKLVEGYKREMEERGIKNFRYGAIYDSPDRKHFATRYAYSHKDIQELTQLTGFRIVEVRKEKLETGEGDENLYYVVEKVS